MSVKEEEIKNFSSSIGITKHDTPMLDELEHGPWPSFISGIKRLRDQHPEERINKMTNDLLGQLEHSYETRKGYWKGGTVSVYGYGGGIIPRFSEVGDVFPESKEFHTLRVQPPAGNHYTTDILRKLADSWEKCGSGLVTFHGQTGNIMFIGSTTDATQHFFDDIHRPALPYKFKFKVSGCPNDCMNSIERADMSIIGTWRDDMKVDQHEVQEFIKLKGRKYVIDNVVTRCPTNAISVNDDNTFEIDNKNCVRCMHCLNVMPKALSPGDDRGASILMGGKRTLKIGDLMGTVIVPFMKLESQEDWDKLVELAEDTIDFWAENALEHERCGEMIERIGLVNFLDGIGVDVDPNMVATPRESSYVRLDDWDQEAIKWYEKKKANT